MKLSKHVLLLIIAALVCSSTLAQQKSNKKKGKTEAMNYEYSSYQVTKGETYESIADKNKIPATLLKAFNSEAGPELAPGVFIKIPILPDPVPAAANTNKGTTTPAAVTAQPTKAPATTTPQSANSTKPTNGGPNTAAANTNAAAANQKVVDTQVKIAILLPFNAEKAADSLKLGKRGGYNAALEFYEGMKLAIDSLVPKGLNIKLSVYDTKADTNELKKILKKPELKENNLIIGPFSNKELNFVSIYARGASIPFVSPIPTTNPTFVSNPMAILANTTIETQCKVLADYIATNFAKQNIIIPHTEKGKDAEIATLLRNMIAQKRIAIVKDVVLGDAGAKSVGDAVAPSLKNLILLINDNENTLTEIINQVNFKKDKGEVSIIGPASWENFQNVDLELLQMMQPHIIKMDYVDAKSVTAKLFKKKYYTIYKSDATTFTYQGFDLMFCLGAAIMQYGRDFNKNLASFPAMKTMHTEYAFKPTRPNGALENTNFSLLKLKDLEWTKVVLIPDAPINTGKPGTPNKNGSATTKPGTPVKTTK